MLQGFRKKLHDSKVKNIFWAGNPIDPSPVPIPNPCPFPFLSKIRPALLQLARHPAENRRTSSGQSSGHPADIWMKTPVGFRADIRRIYGGNLASIWRIQLEGRELKTWREQAGIWKRDGTRNDGNSSSERCAAWSLCTNRTVHSYLLRVQDSLSFRVETTETITKSMQIKE